MITPNDMITSNDSAKLISLLLEEHPEAAKLVKNHPGPARLAGLLDLLLFTRDWVKSRMSQMRHDDVKTKYAIEDLLKLQ